ncbi:MAG: T9SS type A sorting domain-containing protein [Ignavibacteriales bacterium]|nr:T9SS type A sorting domain-containing protein [Ignavibacteriales bacterium]MCF8438194.1 T9SS type A sorting domain-containing protein [Ignavibacteriales bacterium]
MKNAICVLFFITSVLIGQNPTFERIYASEGVAYEVVQSSAGYYLLNYRTGTAEIISTDDEGFFLWTKEIPDGKPTSGFWNNIEVTSAGEILVGGTNTDFEKKRPQITRISSEGQNLESANYPSDNDEYCNYIQILPGNNIIMFSSEYPYKLIFSKLAPDLSIITQKVVTEENNLLGNDSKIFYDESYFYTNALPGIMKIDTNGNVISRIWTDKQFVSIYPYSSDRIVGSYVTKFMMTDTSGALIWERNTGMSINGVNNLSVLSDGRIAAYPSYLKKLIFYDQNGEKINETSLGVSIGTLLQKSDTKLLIPGSSLNRAYLARLNSDGSLKSLRITSPLAGAGLNSFLTQRIAWTYKLIGQVDISYSVDGGNTWELIAGNVTAANLQYDFTLGLIHSESLRFRIRDSQAPEYYDMTQGDIVIAPYNATDYIAGNEIKCWFNNNGLSAHNPYSDGSGLYWPGGENATIPAVFNDGVLIGGVYDGQKFVHGATYRAGLMSGEINPDGSNSSPYLGKYQLFRIKNDWENLPAGDERDKYQYNHDNWPADAGAPFLDINGNGIYEPNTDSPRKYGDEIMYYASHTNDNARSTFLYGSPALPLQVQTTIYAYDTDNYLRDAIFKRVRIINKSQLPMTDMYFSLWSDDDLGDANDDYAGCDTLLDLGYVYNGDNDDNGYYGLKPPAVGRAILQGPYESSPGDTAKFDDRLLPDHKNIPMTSFVFYIGGDPVYSDPDMGVYNGTLEMYNNMQGKGWNGFDFINPVTGSPTLFCLSGDPFTGEGWIETLSDGDRRTLMSTGPFNLAPADTQEIVYAVFLARGNSNLNSVFALKEMAQKLKYFYDNGEVTGIDNNSERVPNKYYLSQNYPNPFNPETAISYELKDEAHVRLFVYDVLGREVATLVNGKKPQGKHRVNFNAFGLSSGIYFYSIYLRGKDASGFTAVRKMILLK